MRALWLAVYGAAFVWSVVEPYDYFTWFLEALPALVAFGVLAKTRRRFPLTPLLYTLILVHCLILFLGAHYTYAQVETFQFVRDLFCWRRNNFDKLGHFAQGFVPAILAREILSRCAVVSSRGWLNLFVVSICLAFSALYELFEWGVAVAIGDSAESFLGTQGYVWDTQSDMAMALSGAVLALGTLGKIHDAQLRRFVVTQQPNRTPA
jgi:putative membrane protein